MSQSPILSPGGPNGESPPSPLLEGPYRVEAIPQFPAKEEAQNLLNRFHGEGYELVACLPTLIQLSRVNPTRIPGLYCVLKKRDVIVAG